MHFFLHQKSAFNKIIKSSRSFGLFLRFNSSVYFFGTIDSLLQNNQRITHCYVYAYALNIFKVKVTLMYLAPQNDVLL